MEARQKGGERLIVQGYHGTNAVFPGECILDKSDQAYLTTNKAVAASFGDRILNLKVKSRKPYEIDWLGCSWGGGFFPSDDELFEHFIEFAAGDDEEEREYWEENGMCVDMFASYVASQGYDMLAVANVREEHGFSEMEYVVMFGCEVSEIKC